MATSPDPKQNTPSSSGKPVSSAMSDIQKRAERLANSRKPVSAKQFLEEAIVELKKTTWPTRDILVKSTSVVLGLVVSVGIFVGGLDYLLTKLTSGFFT